MRFIYIFQIESPAALLANLFIDGMPNAGKGLLLLIYSFFKWQHIAKASAGSADFPILRTV